MSIYIPQQESAERVTERLSWIAKEKDRSLNYIIVAAILEYLDRADIANP
jgi:predicted transcriptional regulator